jgi:hypothetical protein
MRIATAASHAPSVGRAVMFDQMQGHSSVQLQVSMYCPLMFQLDMAVLLANDTDLQAMPRARKLQAQRVSSPSRTRDVLQKREKERR